MTNLLPRALSSLKKDLMKCALVTQKGEGKKKILQLTQEVCRGAAHWFILLKLF